MKVNEGELKFDESPMSLEDMVRQIFEKQKINTSVGYVNTKINKLFMKSDTKRYQEGATATVSTKTARDDRDLTNKRINYLRSEYQMRMILGDISVFHNIETKKILLVWLIRKGFLYNFPNTCHLVEDEELFSRKFSADDAAQIIDDNKYLNKLIDRYKSKEYKDVRLALERYDNFVKSAIKPDLKYEDLKEQYGLRAIHEEQVSNIKKYMMYWIQEDKWTQYVAELVELRKNTKYYSRGVTDEILCNHFDLSISIYYKNYFEALNLLIKTSSFDLMRELDNEEIETN